jgi:hypothetical protein
MLLFNFQHQYIKIIYYKKKLKLVPLILLHQTHGTVDCNRRLIQQFHKCFGLMASRRFLMLLLVT